MALNRNTITWLALLRLRKNHFEIFKWKPLFFIAHSCNLSREHYNEVIFH